MSHDHIVGNIFSVRRKVGARAEALLLLGGRLLQFFSICGQHALKFIVEKHVAGIVKEMRIVLREFKQARVVRDQFLSGGGTTRAHPSVCNINIIGQIEINQ